ncbi:DUF4352 domain-containing protein [Chloroflexota bacterium]
MKRVLIVVLVLVLAALACNGGDGSEEKKPQLKKSHIGDIIQVEDSTIILNSTEFSNDTLTANITIENGGSEELFVSGLLHFDAIDGEGTKLVHRDSCPTPFVERVQPGDKFRGNTCFIVKPETELVKLYYTTGILSDDSVMWEANR